MDMSLLDRKYLCKSLTDRKKWLWQIIGYFVPQFDKEFLTKQIRNSFKSIFFCEPILNYVNLKVLNSVLSVYKIIKIYQKPNLNFSMLV